jgi:hypothetical protein
MLAFSDLKFGVALKELFHRLHLGATSIYKPSLEEYLQRWHRSRKVYCKANKKAKTTKAKGVDLDEHSDTNDNDDANRTSENVVENVKGKRKLSTSVKQDHKLLITVEKLIGINSTLPTPIKILNSPKSSTVECDGCEILLPTHNHNKFPPQRFCVDDVPLMGASMGKGWIKSFSPNKKKINPETNMLINSSLLTIRFEKNLHARKNENEAALPVFLASLVTPRSPDGLYVITTSLEDENKEFVADEHFIQLLDKSFIKKVRIFLLFIVFLHITVSKTSTFL